MKTNHRKGKYGEYYFEATHQKNKCYVVIYPDRIVICALDNDFVKTESKRLIKELKGEIHKGKKLNRQQKLYEVEKHWFTYGKHYTDMTPEEAVMEHRDNFAVDRSEIQKIIYGRTSSIRSTNGKREIVREGCFEMHTPTKVYRINHMYYYVKAQEKMLAMMFGDHLEIHE